LDADSALNWIAIKRHRLNGVLGHPPRRPQAPEQSPGDNHCESDGCAAERCEMIRKLKSGQYRLYSRKMNPKTGKRRNLGTFKSRAAAEKHERAVQYFKHH
jgi:hypothetical protein